MNTEEKDFWQELEVLDKQHWMSDSMEGKGDLSFSGNLRISGTWDGTLTGKDESSYLHLLKNSKMSGRLKAFKIQVEGQCENCRIEAKVLLIKAGARITGEIRADTVSVEEGAIVEARFTPSHS